MESIFKKIAAMNIDNIANKLFYLAQISNVDVPNKVITLLDIASEIKKYDSYESFISKSPDEIKDPEFLVNMYDMLRWWDYIIQDIEKFKYMAKFLQTVRVGAENSELELLQDSLKTLFPTVIFSQPHRADEFETRFEEFARKYAKKYLQIHQEHNNKIRSLQPQIDDLIHKITIMEELSCIDILKPYCTIPDIQNVRIAIIKDFSLCDYSPSEDDILKHFVCPKCKFSLADFYNTMQFDELNSSIEPAFQKCMRALVSNLSTKIIDSEENAIDALVKAVSVSDVDAIKNIFSGKFLEKVKELLDNGR